MSVQIYQIYDNNKEHFHLLPGRLRVSVPGLLNNQALANILARRLTKLPGIKAGFVNPVTGRVLVYFEPRGTDLQLLIMVLLGSNPARNQRRNHRKPTLPGTIHKSNQVNRVVSSHSHGIPWHTYNTSQILTMLESNTKTGLSSNVARERLWKYGYNELIERPRPSLLHIAFESLKGFMTQLLLIAGGVSLLVGETADAAVIVAIVVLQAVVEAAQSKRAEKSLAALKELSAPAASVFRDGRVQRIPARELVPGDIILLEAGDKVPADARILQTSNLTTNEACLTGESVPVVKDNIIRNDTKMSIVDQENMLFSGTSITGGRSIAVVVGTGMKTEMGKIATLLSQVETEQTNLQKQLEHLGKKITKLVVVSVGVIATVNLLQGRSIWEVLRTAISLAVGAVPEGLPAVLTVALASGVQRMVKRNAVVRRLSAVETLGSATVICTDKTGTLTKNEMTVKEVFIHHDFYEFTGKGYQPTGEIVLDGQKITELSPALKQVLKAAILCNNAELKADNKIWRVIGDPTEGALLTAAAKAGLWWEDIKTQHGRHKEIAFDSTRKMMTVVCKESGGDYGVYIKGAPDKVINYCSHYLTNENDLPLDIRTRRQILAANDYLAGKALRVLASAYKKLPAGTDLGEIDLESDLTFCGLIGMADPPREGVKEAIHKCRGAGVNVVMITGDHQKTAEAIAAKLGILDNGTSITGEELEKLTDEELGKRVESIVVYSRTSPEQKLRIVQALKRRGQIVAMTGDGVNDAPAIKEANIGIAMGLSGTDVTREAAGITLSDDNFVTIVNGIEEGRTVSLNLSKSVRYILSGSLGQLLAVFTTATIGLPTPLLPPQILWVNLVTESLPAMSLTADPPQRNCMRQPPLNPNDRFLPDKGRTIIRRGILTGITTFGVYAAGLEFGGWSLNKARTMAFSQLVMGRVFNLINERKKKDESAPGFKENPLILPAAAMSTFMLAITMYLPFMRPLFSTVPIGLSDWGLLIANAFFSGKIDTILDSRNKKAPLALTASTAHFEQKQLSSERYFPKNPIVESNIEHVHVIS